MSFLRELQQWSPERKKAVALSVTVVAAAILLPVWFWHVKYTGLVLKSESQVSSNVTSEEANLTFPNPIEEIDKQLQETLSQPATIKSAKTVDEELVILISLTNTTFTNLVVPLSDATLVASSGKTYTLRRVTNPEGGQAVPIVSAGLPAEMVFYFDKVFNGNYSLKLSNLKYEDEGQSPFEQSLSFEVKDAYLPRT